MGAQGTLAAQTRPALLRVKPSRPQAAAVGRPLSDSIFFFGEKAV